MTMPVMGIICPTGIKQANYIALAIVPPWGEQLGEGEGAGEGEAATDPFLGPCC